MEKYILIVEDPSIVALTIEAQRVELGYKIAGVAAAGETAIQMAREKKPDLILMDVNLEGEMNGISGCGTDIHVSRRPHHLPYLRNPMKKPFRRAGLTSPGTYLTKP